MSGFGTMKKEGFKPKEEPMPEMPPHLEPEGPPAPRPKREGVNPLEAELQSLMTMRNKSHVFCGLVGHENNGKTGIVMDAHMYNVAAGETYGADDQMWVLDFDGGGAACHSAHWQSTPNIRVWNPHVVQSGNRVANDYPATHQRIMDICMFAVEKAEEQNQPGYEGPYLRNFLVTAVDLFDQICINNMKIYDMETGAKDAIEASAHVINTKIGWNWGIRSTRFHQLTLMSRQLMRLGVNVFWETHLTPEVFKDKETGAWRPKWEKQSDNVLNQILWFHKHTVRNEDGKETGEVRYDVEFYKEKTNSGLQGQTRTIFVTKRGEKPTWYGLPELRDHLL